MKSYYLLLSTVSQAQKRNIVGKVKVYFHYRHSLLYKLLPLHSNPFKQTIPFLNSQVRNYCMFTLILFINLCPKMSFSILLICLYQILDWISWRDKFCETVQLCTYSGLHFKQPKF